MTPSSRSIRAFLLVEAAGFGVAASIHGGVLMSGFEHRQATIAESIIATVLVVGIVASLARPALTRWLGITAQSFALLGTLVGIFTIIIGIGPRTVPDVLYHVGIVIVLVCGLVVAARTRP